MENPRLSKIVVDDVIYGVMWWDFGDFMRLDVYQNNRRIGVRRLPIRVDQGYRTIQYLIRRMVGGYGIAGRFIPKRKELNHGTAN
jgi:hypothetical protein